MTPSADSSPARALPALLELQARPQWVCWRREERQGRFTKVPYNARTGKRAASDTPATWSSYDQAVRALRTGTYHGLGYVFHRDYTGIDLDHCVNPDAQIDSWARRLPGSVGQLCRILPQWDWHPHPGTWHHSERTAASGAACVPS